MAEADDITETTRELNPQQARFVEEYLLDLNATRAAIRAGYSPGTAHSAGPRLLGHVGVAEAIAIGQQQRSRRVGVSQDRILMELASIAFADIGEVVRIDKATGKVFVRDLEELRPEARRAISEVTQTTTERTETGKDGKPSALIERVRLGVRHHSKTTALKLLMDHLGMVAPVKVDTTHSGTVEVGLESMPLEELLRLRNG